MIRIGLDLSLNSPGISLQTQEGKIISYFVPQRKRERALHFKSTKIEIHPLYGYSKEFSSVEKYSWIWEQLHVILQKYEFKHIHVAIEGYAYGKNTGHSHKLAELGGVIRYQLHQHQIPYTVFAPSKVKKEWTGKGNANKIQMHEALIAKQFPNLLHIFQIKSKTNIKPVEDITDSIALLHCIK